HCARDQKLPCGLAPAVSALANHRKESDGVRIHREYVFLTFIHHADEHECDGIVSPFEGNILRCTGDPRIVSTPRTIAVDKSFLPRNRRGSGIPALEPVLPTDPACSEISSQASWCQ